ncbi:hypothetical protein D6C85_05694 [Aureobasidium pullulans]|uniref:Uncharacterized protein n=1 Tax=Aureobasidium pullulans TaxID=5580 RepID=A0A4S9WXS3_AURPU|nr:hypothetical protein D6C85_05694 [Aureobasidium pullulans]
MDNDTTMLDATGEPFALPVRNPGAPERHEEPVEQVNDANDDHAVTQTSTNDAAAAAPEEAAQPAVVRQWCIWHERMVATHSSEECTRGQRLQAQGYTEPPPRISRSARRQGAAATHGRGGSRGGRGGARRGGRGRGRGRGRGGRGGTQGATT